LFYVLIVASVLSVFGIGGSIILRPWSDSSNILASLTRLPMVGTNTFHCRVPGATQPADEEDIVVPPAHSMVVQFRGDELRKFVIESTENLAVAADENAEIDTLDTVDVKANEPFTWTKRPDTKHPFGEGEVTELFIRNRGPDEAKVEITLTTDVVNPEIGIIPVTTIGIFVVFLAYILQTTLMPRLSAIALATFKSEIAQPLFLVILVVGTVALILDIYVPYNTFGEDIKMLKDSGLTLIRVFCIFLAVWGASTTIADEIDGKTALTVLSKPIGRRSFVVGKFFGIGWTTALMYIILGAVLLVVISYKVMYDSRESSKEIPIWQACYLEMASAVPGLVLCFMETMVLAALSVAISTRLPMFANFMLVFTVYVLGHLIPLISQVTEDRFEIVKFFGQFSAAVFPNLEAFDIQSAIAGGLAVPNEYLSVSLLYCVLLSAVAMLLALILFEDRDLA